jgi:signal transduction histidine kinase
VKQLHGEAGRLGVELSCRVDGGATVSGNAVQLELVIHNVLRNALQATPPGGRVEACVAADGERVQLTVIDTGQGVPEEMRDAIFEPFVTTRQGRGGTGLGLAVTRDIVRAHGGEITVEPNAPTGTVVRVTIPAGGGDDAYLDH